jgi:diketogulonate reductase-like aldo/keto reductase
VASSKRLARAIGDRYDKTAAQVALRWLVYREHVVAIPKAPSREHLESNEAIQLRAFGYGDGCAGG